MRAVSSSHYRQSWSDLGQLSPPPSCHAPGHPDLGNKERCFPFPFPCTFMLLVLLCCSSLPMLFPFWCFAVRKSPVLLYLQALFSFCSKPVFWLRKMRVACSLATTTVLLLSCQLQPGLFKASLHTGGCFAVLDANCPLIDLSMHVTGDPEGLLWGGYVHQGVPLHRHWLQMVGQGAGHISGVLWFWYK